MRTCTRVPLRPSTSVMCSTKQLETSPSYMTLKVAFIFPCTDPTLEGTLERRNSQSAAAGMASLNEQGEPQIQSGTTLRYTPAYRAQGGRSGGCGTPGSGSLLHSSSPDEQSGWQTEEPASHRELQFWQMLLSEVQELLSVATMSLLIRTIFGTSVLCAETFVPLRVYLSKRETGQVMAGDCLGKAMLQGLRAPCSPMHPGYGKPKPLQVVTSRHVCISKRHKSPLTYKCPPSSL